MRTVNRLLALVLGLALAAVAVLTGLEAVQLHRGEAAVLVPRGDWARALSTLEWRDGDLRRVAAVVIAVGVVLLLVQLVPRRASRYALRSRADRPSWIARSSLDRLLTDAARSDDEVLGAEATTSGRRATVVVTTAKSIDRDQLRQRVSTTIEERLAGIEFERPPAVNVRARHAKERVR